MRIDFAIIGAQKAATTYLHQCLSAHSDVYMPRRETSVFEDPDYGTYAQASLASMFMERPEPRVGIRRPNYLGREEVPARIALHCPDIKLVCILRDPVSRAISAVYHQMSSGFLPVMDIEDCIEALLDGALQERYPRARDILNFGLYHRHLSNYARYFDRGSLFVARQETLLSEDANGISRVFEHLGLSPPPASGLRSKVRQPGHYHPVTLRLKRLSIAMAMRRNESNTRSYHRNGFLQLAGRGVEEIADVLAVHVIKAPPPKLSDELGRRLYAFYERDLFMLERDWGISSRDWSMRWQAPGSAEHRFTASTLDPGPANSMV